MLMRKRLRLLELIPPRVRRLDLAPPGLLKEGLDLTERERGIKRAVRNGLSELKPP